MLKIVAKQMHLPGLTVFFIWETFFLKGISVVVVTREKVANV